MTDQPPGGINVRQLREADVPDHVDRLVSIWALSKPGSDTSHPRQLILEHSQCSGFRCFAADDNGVIVGFTYGLRDSQGTGAGGPGPSVSVGSHDLIAEKVARGMLPPTWLDAFDVAELQVLRERRRRGIGERLIRALCEGLPPGRVVLTVEDDATAAKDLYQKLGFDVLFQTTPPLVPLTPLTVMGRALPMPPT